MEAKRSRTQADAEGVTSGDESVKGLRPIERALDLIGARWTLILVRHLLESTYGFQELRGITGITPRLLSVRLTELIEQGFVEKVPVGNRARYRLTDFGRTLEPVVREISLWWLRHAMPRFGPYEGANPAAVFEAISFLLGSDRTQNADSTYDLRLNTQENGGWTVEFVSAPKSGDSALRPKEEVSAEPSVAAIDTDESAAAAGLAEARPGGGYGATGTDTGGSIIWHPRPYTPDRN